MSEQNYISEIEKLMENDLDKALQLCHKALQIYPETAQFYYLKAVILWNKSEPQDLCKTSFETLLQQASALAPLNPEPHQLWGYANEVLGNYDLALQGYSRAIAVCEKEPELYYKRACIYHLLEMYQEAVEDCTQAITLAGESAREIYYAQRGASKRGLKDIEGSLQDYQKSVETNPNYIGGFLDMGEIYYLQKRYQEALNCTDKAVEKAPNQPICYGMRADIKKKMNDLIGALEDYQQVLFLNPKDQKILGHIGYLQNLLLEQIAEGTQQMRVQLKSGHKAMITSINGRSVTFVELPQK